jgi:hypothetical protein
LVFCATLICYRDATGLGTEPVVPVATRAFFTAAPGVVRRFDGVRPDPGYWVLCGGANGGAFGAVAAPRPG